ncbi:MAG: hypothetical protein NC349_08925 [Paenibacillus sp.]|nr:hypothetical protein [Paenibacillus sp.]
MIYQVELCFDVFVLLKIRDTLIFMHSNIFTQVLSFLKVKYTERYANSLFINQPYRNTLYGIGLLLDHYNIKHECLQLKEKKNVLKNSLPPVIIAYQGRFCILSRVRGSSVILIDAEGQEIELTGVEFFAQWDGIGLFIYPSENSREPNFKKNNVSDIILNLKNALLIGCSIILIVFIYVQNFETTSVSYNAILISNILGVYITYLLLQNELLIKNNIADKLCSLIGYHSCDKVTKSEASSIFGIAKLSEIGFAYFSVNIITLLLNPNLEAYFSLFAIFVLPFTFWSIWYQKYRIKSWCVLCLMTIGVMWVQAILCVIFGMFKFENFNVKYIFVTGISYIIGILCINRIIPFIKAMRESLIWKLEYESLKVHDKVIDAFTKDMPLYKTDKDSCSSIIFGNSNSKYKITVLSNPYCQPCAKMHQRLNKIIIHDVCIQYVFTSFSPLLDNINRYIIAFYKRFGAEHCWNMLTNWYEFGKKQNEEFFESVGLNIEKSDVVDEFQKHVLWRKDKLFIGTPTILINGMILTAPYSVEDYVYVAK